VSINVEICQSIDDCMIQSCDCLHTLCVHLYVCVVCLTAVQVSFVAASHVMLSMCASTGEVVRWTCGCVASVRLVACCDVGTSA